MTTSKTSAFTARLSRLLFASIAAGAIANQGAHAAIDGEATYNAKFVVPRFVPDVRTLIADAATRHSWKITDERPGEVTLELRHAKSHMIVVAKAYYTQSEFWFHRVSANTWQCEPQHPCKVDPEIVHRWMIGLRREAGVSLLRLAIQDAGGNVAPNREPVAETN